MCANQQVCPDVRERLENMGLEFLRDTPESADSDLIMVDHIEKNKIQQKMDEILKVCGKLAHQVSVRVDYAAS